MYVRGLAPISYVWVLGRASLLVFFREVHPSQPSGRHRLSMRRRKGVVDGNVSLRHNAMMPPCRLHYSRDRHDISPRKTVDKESWGFGGRSFFSILSDRRRSVGRIPTLNWLISQSIGRSARLSVDSASGLHMIEEHQHPPL